MKTSELINLFLSPEATCQGSGVHRFYPEPIKAAASRLVELLLEEGSLPKTALTEASVHRARRSKVYVASFYGSDGRQTWKSTGSTDYLQALTRAREWESQARRQRAAGELGLGKTPVRIRSSSIALLTQKQVAQLLGLTERGVRAIEKRAIAKLRQALRQLWREYTSGTLEESSWTLTPEEIRGLFDLAQTHEELRLIEKIVEVIQ